MTWCIEASNFDVDVDLLFQENSSIGQKMYVTAHSTVWVTLLVLAGQHVLFYTFIIKGPGL